MSEKEKPAKSISEEVKKPSRPDDASFSAGQLYKERKGEGVTIQMQTDRPKDKPDSNGK